MVFGILIVMKRYNPIETEKKWQQIWADDGRYDATDFASKPKYYVSGMFPYPSGAGMHTGHFFEHSIVDVVARFRRALGYNVMYPMGWDSFGLPAENYAIKTGTTPQAATSKNIANFKEQLRRVGSSIDWSREINTADPDYYKWTQWIFTQLYSRGLAYQKEAMQWWCPKDKTVLANEQVIDGKCWRCESVVEKKAMKQWFFKITEYADALLEELPSLNWPQKIKTAQENWIGRSEGAEIEFIVDGIERPITVFTTRPDTIFGATFLVLAPEHELARRLVTDETKGSVLGYIEQALKKSEIERQSEGKDKTGVFSGSYATNPATGEKVPIWIADYVLGGYGTGAIMAVPAHDERDLEFAEKFGIDVRQVVMQCEADPYNPPKDGLEEVTRETIIVHLLDRSTGKYALLDWHGSLKGITTAIMGGIEEGQTAEDAVLAEINEEASIDNVRIVKRLRWVSAALYCASHKNQNRKAITHAFLAEVDNLEGQREIAADEQKIHTLIWVNKEDVLDSLTPVHQKYVWEQLNKETPVTDEGILINSGAYDGMESSEAREEIVAWLEQQGLGRAKVSYKMRDWLISRQRYWGAPIPIIHCDKDGAVAVPDRDLPVVLPEVTDFAPRGDGTSVLGAQADWAQTTCPKCGGKATRETDTMDGYACSSWYLLRFTDPNNSTSAWDPAKVNYWAPLDMYVGGDHAVAHLLYVRFWTHVFYDLGLVAFKEPVNRLVYHGLIQAEDGRKMSKSYGNVVDPLEVIDQGYGADALRTFELFLGPINEDSNWSSRGITGVYRFLNRVWTLVQEADEAMGAKPKKSTDEGELTKLTHRTIKKVTEDMKDLRLNTAIAALMEFVNELYKLKLGGFNQEWVSALQALIKMVQPFAPHMAAELWQQLGYNTQLDFEAWPDWDESKLSASNVTLAVQINGKVRSTVEIEAGLNEQDALTAALAIENIQKYTQGKTIVKTIYIPGKVINIVIK